MDVFEAIYKRRSIRRFVEGAEAPKETIDKILETTTYVPGPSPFFFIFPWRYIFITDLKTREMLGSFGRETARVLFGLIYEVFRGHLWYVPPESKDKVHAEAATGELWRYPAQASFVIVPCFARAAWGTEMMPLATIPVADLCSATIGMTCENMWLAATSLGVASAMNAMPLNDARRREMAVDVLGIPHSWELLGAFSFGVPSQKRFVGPSRAPLEGVVFEEVWGNNYVRAAFKEEKLEFGETPKVDLFETMKKQEHVQRFREEKVPDWKIEKILDAAKWAPDPENLQHFRYIVVRKDKKLKEALYKWNMEFAHMTKDLVPEVGEMMASMLQFPQHADTVIFPCSTRTAWLEYPFPAGTSADHIFAGATAHGMQNMWLASIALGLGATYDLTPVIDNRRKELLCNYLGIPPSWEPLGAIYIGVPEEYIPSFKSTTVSELFFSEQWGNKYG